MPLLHITATGSLLDFALQQTEFSIVLPQLSEETSVLADGITVFYQLLSLPLYLVIQLKRIFIDLVNTKT